MAFAAFSPAKFSLPAMTMPAAQQANGTKRGMGKGTKGEKAKEKAKGEPKDKRMRNMSKVRCFNC